ncbi:MAG: hypothetical protein U0798_06755 [Gemmataceae bacterium]
MRRILWIGVIGFVASALAWAQSGTTHKNAFNGKTPFWQQGETNVKIVELDHAIGTRHAYNAPSAEMIKIDAQPGNESSGNEFAHYIYPTPKALVTPQLAAGIQIKAFRPGIQLRARVVLPKHRDPRNPNAPFTTYITGDTYKDPGKWDRLTLGDPVDGLKKVRALVTAAVKQPADFTDAYVDQLILNVYAGPGVTEIWVDDLEIGPCESTSVPRTDTLASRAPARPASIVGEGVRFVDGQIRVGNKPFFIKAIRLTDTDPFVLANCLFNTVWLPADARADVIDDVVRQGLKIVPSIPLPSGDQATPVSLSKDADVIAGQLQRFANRDPVLMWDLGGGRTFEEVGRLRRAADLVKQFDPKRPRIADLWDGYEAYSNYLDVVGTHRWPLFTSLELSSYKDWLKQRKTLAGSDKLMFTWVQTHLPDWYINLTGLSPDAKAITSPIGPHPEQLRLLTYLSIAAGCRGIGYWSDRYLADSHHGRDRLLQLCLLNSEIKMIEPILAADHGATTWVDTNNPNIKAAVIPTEKYILVMPIWLGAGSQYCPELSAIGNLKIRVPNVSESAEPWLLNPCDVINLKTRGDSRPVPGGTEITIPEFDTTALIVFTNDTSKMLVEWQDYTKHTSGERCARWATTLAEVEYNKTLALQERLQNIAPPVANARQLLEDSQKSYRAAEKYLESGQPNLAYREAMRALWPLRVLMREHWRLATASLDTPTASPYATSVYSLPKHWDLAKRLSQSKPSANVLPNGSFDLSASAPPQGAAIASLPGWIKTADTIDPVVLEAALVNADTARDKSKVAANFPASDKETRKDTVVRASYLEKNPSNTDAKRDGPSSNGHVLKLSMKPLREKDSTGKPLPPPGALERSYVSVDSPPVSLPPGTLVRISFWVRVPEQITAGVDGALVYDDAGGEGLALRISAGPNWKKYHLYRIVPASGSIALRFALTGIGTVYFDDAKIEPMLPGGADVSVRK